MLPPSAVIKGVNQMNLTREEILAVVNADDLAINVQYDFSSNNKIQFRYDGKR